MLSLDIAEGLVLKVQLRGIYSVPYVVRPVKNTPYNMP